MFHIGPFRIDSRVLLAPMAGVSDAPFRRICRDMGAGLTTSEMLTADTRLWDSRKSSLRLQEDEARSNNQHGASTLVPRSVQIAGSDAAPMANAARAAVDNGAEIVDINMGCPAKKVCNKAAGSALLRDEKLVEEILQAVVGAVDVPVTLKIRTGWCPESRNGVNIARIAEDAGIQALAVHGRTRACRFAGEAEYETIAEIVDTLRIPVIANGDIDSPRKAARVLATTGADAVMVGRAAQGQPWLIKEMDYHIKTRGLMAAPAISAIADTVGDHLQSLYHFYGDYLGLRIARKHVKWYLQKLAERSPELSAGNHQSELAGNLKSILKIFNTIDSAERQYSFVQQFFERLITREDIAA